MHQPAAPSPRAGESAARSGGRPSSRSLTARSALVHLEEQPRHARQRRRPPRVHRRREMVAPREQQQVAVVRVVIGVVVRDEDVAQRAEDAGDHHLAGDAVAAVDHVAAVADDDDLRGARARLLGRRPARGAEQDQPGLGGLRRDSLRITGRRAREDTSAPAAAMRKSRRSMAAYSSASSAFLLRTRGWRFRVLGVGRRRSAPAGQDWRCRNAREGFCVLGGATMLRSSCAACAARRSGRVAQP